MRVLHSSQSASQCEVIVFSLLTLTHYSESCTNVDLFLSWSSDSACKEKGLLFKKFWWPCTVDLNMVCCLLFLVVFLLLGVLPSEAALDYFLFSLSTVCQESVPVLI